MNKQEIIANIAETHGITKIVAKQIFEQIFDDMVSSMMSSSSDKKFKIPGFGSFKIDERAARTGRNPRNGDLMNIPAKNVMKFKISKTLSEKIN